LEGVSDAPQGPPPDEVADTAWHLHAWRQLYGGLCLALLSPGEAAVAATKLRSMGDLTPSLSPKLYVALYKELLSMMLDP